MLPLLARTYLITALGGTPEVLNGLLAPLGPEDQQWDFRPEPERFTLCEVVARLTWVEPNRRERAVRTRDEEQPFFSRASIQNAGSENTAPSVNLAAFRDSRQQLVDVLRGLDDA